MAIGIKRRLDRLSTNRSPENRFVDIASQLHVVARDGDSLVWTGEQSPVYGGKWDTRSLEYIGPADRIIHVPCSPPQFEFALSTSSITEFSGGRGLGKSEGAILSALKLIPERPFIDGRIVSPTAELYRIQWDKFVPILLETGWLLPEDIGVREAKHELWFWNGVCVQFRSAHKPKRLRSWGGGWCLLDEAQDIATDAVDILLFCLREGGDNFQMRQQLTPSKGEAFKRHQEYEAISKECEADAKCIHADSYSNPFISHKVFDLAARRMDKDRYGVEVLGDWDIIARLEADDKAKPVFPCLVDEWKQYQDGAEILKHEWKNAEDFFEDITRQTAQKKTGALAGYSWRYIAGMDPGTTVPNEFVIWRVFRRKRSADKRPIWVAWDMLTAKGHCGHLGDFIIEAGYSPKEVSVVPDFSAWGRSYVLSPSGNGRAGKGLGPSAAQLIREKGFYVAGGRSNPRVQSSIDDVQEKLDPAIGEPRIFFRLPETAALFENMAAVCWDKNGRDFDPAIPNDKTDAGRYPISYFDPAGRISGTGIQLFVSK